MQCVNALMLLLQSMYLLMHLYKCTCLCYMCHFPVDAASVSPLLCIYWNTLKKHLLFDTSYVFVRLPVVILTLL